MAHLGEFGTAVAQANGETPEDDTFTFHGELFIVPGGLSSLVLMEFAAAAKDAQAQQEAAQVRKVRALDAGDQGAAQAAEVAGMSASTALLSAMHSYLQACIGREQWERFRRTALDFAVQTDELMDVCGRVFSAVAERPTSRPSSSADGRSSTGAGSTVSSDSQGPTPGPSPAGSPVELSGRVVELPLSDAAAQRREFGESMVPVADLIRSSG